MPPPLSPPAGDGAECARAEEGRRVFDDDDDDGGGGAFGKEDGEPGSRCSNDMLEESMPWAGPARRESKPWARPSRKESSVPERAVPERLGGIPVSVVFEGRRYELQLPYGKRPTAGSVLREFQERCPASLQHGATLWVRGEQLGTEAFISSQFSHGPRVDAPIAPDLNADLAEGSEVILARRCWPVYAACAGGVAQLNGDTGELRWTAAAAHAGHDVHALHLSRGKCGDRLFTSSDDDAVRAWDAATGDRVRAFGPGHGGAVRAVQCDGDGARVFTAGDDGRIRAWDTATGELLRVLSGHRRCVTSLCLSPGGTCLYSGSEDGTVQAWDLEGPFEEYARTMEGHGDGVLAVCAAPDGAALYSASRDKTVRAWAPRTGAHARTLEGHTGQVRCVAVSRCSAYVISGSTDATVRIWGRGGELRRALSVAHNSWVLSACVSPHGQFLFAGCRDGTLRVWRLPGGDVVRCVAVGRAAGVREGVVWAVAT